MHDDKPNAVEEAKRRLRRAIKLFHNAEENWSTEMVAEFEADAPKDMTLLEWIDAGIEAIPSATQQPLEALQRDKSRLDWLEHRVDDFANIDRISSVNGKFNGLASLREAIDSAVRNRADGRTATNEASK